MPQPIQAPAYVPHSYAFWANKFASPVDIATSVARASAPQVGKTPTGTGFINYISKSDSTRQQVDILTRMSNGDPSAVTALKGLNRASLDPKVQQLYDQVTKVGPVGPEVDQSFISRVFDVLSRPMYATSNAFLSAIKEEQAQNHSTDITDWKYLPIIGPSWWAAFDQGKALTDGLSGYTKTSWADVLQQAHPDMPDVAKGVLGFALDIAMDPTSYIGVGVGRGIAKGAAKAIPGLTSDAEKAATGIAKGFQGAEGAQKAAAVQKTLMEEYAKQGLVVPISHLDLSKPEDLTKFFMGAARSDKKGVVGTDLAVKAQHRQAVAIFLDSVKSTITDDYKVTRAAELMQAAMKDGSIVDPVSLHPSLTITSPTYKALTIPEAEVTAKIHTLRSTYGRLNSILSERPEASPLAHKLTATDRALVVKQRDAVKAELDSLITQTPLDMHDPNVIAAVKDLASTNPEFVALTSQAERLRTELQYMKMGGKTQKLLQPMTHDTVDRLIAGDAAHGEHLTNQGVAVGRDVKGPKQTGRIPGDINAGPTKVPAALRDYKAKLTKLDAIEAQRSQILAQHVSNVMDDIHLPESMRLAKYRSMKNWQTVAQRLVKIYERERIGAKAADNTAAALTEAGNLGGAVKAVKAKETLGGLSKQTNKSLENLKRELQFRIHNGELTTRDLSTFLAKEGISDPALIHDFTQLTPETSRILHLGQAIPPEVSKILNATVPDTEKAITLNNRQIHAIEIMAHNEAKQMTDDLMAMALDVMVRSTSPDSRSLLQMRLGFMGNGPVVASLGAPDFLRAAIKKAYTMPVVKQGIGMFDKALVSSYKLDPVMGRVRAREAGRTTEYISRMGEHLRQTFQSVHPTERMDAWNQMLRTDVKAYTNPDLVKALHDELQRIGEKFLPDAFPGLRDPLKVSAVNEWIPRGKLTTSKNKGWRLDAGTLGQGEDPATWLVNALRNSTIKDTDPVQLIWDLQIATEKALARQATIETIVQQFGIVTGEHGATQDPMAMALVNKYGYKGHKLGADNYIFDPETYKQLTKIEELFSSANSLHVFGEYAGKITQVWKRSVTIYNPGFHARNSFGDIFVSWLDGVEGVHGLQSHRMALRTIKRFRKLTDPNDPMMKSMGQPEMLDAYQGAKKAAPMPESQNTVLFRKNGRDITMGDIYAMYVNEGLLSGFTNTEFNAVFKTPKSFGSSPVGQLASRANQNVMHLSEAREDVFRLAHFIDVVRKHPAKSLEVAASEAGARVRKFHFDYSDFTATEKMIFSRLFPFYKWTRKAFPLMVESLFARPGKMLMYPKAVNNIGVGAGYGGSTPDIVTPEWISSRMLAPVFSHGGATTYAGAALPYDALRAVGAPGDSIIGMLHPGLKALLETAQGTKLGSNVPVTPEQQLTGLFPQSNFASKQLTGTGTPEQILSFLTGVTVTQNNSKTINAELQKDKVKQAGVRADNKQQAADLASKLRGY